MSELHYIYAPMNSGKPTALLTNAHSFEERCMPFLRPMSMKPTDNLYVITVENAARKL